jgi:hypothetical protein
MVGEAARNDGEMGIIEAQLVPVFFKGLKFLKDFFD